jgi:hypothetical protein
MFQAEVKVVDIGLQVPARRPWPELVVSVIPA